MYKTLCGNGDENREYKTFTTDLTIPLCKICRKKALKENCGYTTMDLLLIVKEKK
jgi:hypothetical protein